MSAEDVRSLQSDKVETDYPVMPDLASPYFHFHHTLHSGLEILAALGISGRRITVRMAGLGWRPDWIVEQIPSPGTVLHPDVVIQLSIAGLGFFHRLPVGMWDRGREGEVGTKEIVELFDDPFQKARHWILEGARVFDLQPGNYEACGRWIRLFSLEPTDWPESTWYELTLLLPSLHRIAGTEEGIRRCLRHLLDLPLLEIELRQSWLQLEAAEVSCLGTRSSELGIDTILGNRLEDKRLWNIRIGPVSLNRYYAMQSDENSRLLRQTLQLCVPCEQRIEIAWQVLDPAKAPRLGSLDENACLGVNSWMGPVERIMYGPEGRPQAAAAPGE